MGEKEFKEALKKKLGFDPDDFTKCKKCGAKLVACPHCMTDFCPECDQP